MNVILKGRRYLSYPVISDIEECEYRIKKALDLLDSEDVDFNNAWFYGTGTSGAVILTLLTKNGCPNVCLLNTGESIHRGRKEYSNIIKPTCITNTHIFVDDMISSGDTFDKCYNIIDITFNYSITLIFLSKAKLRDSYISFTNP